MATWRTLASCLERTVGGSRLNIAYLITTTHPIGGAQVHVRDLALRMHELGYRVTVLTGGTGALPGLPQEAQVNLPALGRSIHPASDLRAYLQIRAALKRLRPDLLSTHSSKAGWLGRLAARSLGIPVLFTAHGWAFTEGVAQPRRTLYLWAERLVAPLADRIITVSDYDRDLAIRYKVVSPDRLITVHNGMPDVHPNLRAHPEVQPPRLVMVARFGAQKDHATLLRALGRLRGLSWSLDFIGGGEGREAVERLAHVEDLAERVRFLGTRSDVAELLAQAQIFVLASRWEGLPRSILEAMRAGLPVVASDVGGVREAVDHGTTGLLVPPGDVDGLSAALEQLLRQPEARCRMGRAGRARYEAHFTFERMLVATLQVYQTVLELRK